MPILDIVCPEHGTQEIFAHDPKKPNCPTCGKKAKRVWSRPAQFRVDFTSGWDMGAGKYFYTKRERENWIRESGSRRVRD